MMKILRKKIIINEDFARTKQGEQSKEMKQTKLRTTPGDSEKKAIIVQSSSLHHYIIL